MTMKRYAFGQVGGNDGHRRFYINIVKMRGQTPLTYSQKGGSLRPLLPSGPVSPNNVPEKKNGVRGRHGLRAPSHRVIIEFEAGWGTWSASRVCAFGLKRRGYTPT